MSRRPNEVVITGPCRSGTTLFSKLINDLPNTVCTIEVCPRLSALPSYFKETREKIRRGEPIRNRYAKGGGGLTTNPWRDGAEDLAKPVDKELGDDFLLATKMVLGAVTHIEDLLKAGYPVALIVRDPVYTLGSWTDPATAGQTVGMITDENLHWWWKSHPFPWKHADAIKRRAEYWNWLATMIHDARYPKQHEGENDVRLYRYEALVANPKAVLNSFLTSLGRPRIEEAPKLRNMNQDDRYPRLDDIRQAVRQLCPIAKTLGYRVP